MGACASTPDGPDVPAWRTAECAAPAEQDNGKPSPPPAHPLSRLSSLDPYAKAKGNGRVGSITLMRLSSAPMAGFLSEVGGDPFTLQARGDPFTLQARAAPPRQF
jgi:hypothetical protein